MSAPQANHARQPGARRWAYGLLAGAIGMMAFGYWFINGQIEEVM